MSTKRKELTDMMKKFLKDESGATAIEYTLIAALIGVALIAGAELLGGELENTFGFISDELSSARGAGGS